MSEWARLLGEIIKHEDLEKVQQCMQDTAFRTCNSCLMTPEVTCPFRTCDYNSSKQTVIKDE